MLTKFTHCVRMAIATPIVMVGVALCLIGEVIAGVELVELS